MKNEKLNYFFLPKIEVKPMLWHTGRKRENSFSSAKKIEKNKEIQKYIFKSKSF